MTTAADDARQGTSHLYRAMRDFVESTDGTLPGKFEITKEGIVLDMTSPVRPHELTALRLRKRWSRKASCAAPTSWSSPRPTWRERGPSTLVHSSPPSRSSPAPTRTTTGSPNCTGTGAVLTDIHPTPDGPCYATRKDFVYGEDVTLGDWTITTDNLPLYTDQSGTPSEA